MKKAVAGSNNYYIFSETGPGVESLIIVGTSLQIMEFLLSRQHHGILNNIRSLPDIYMGISPFQPRDRFTAVTPIGDALVNVASYFASVIPVPEWVSLVSSPTSLESMRKSVMGLSNTQKAAGQLYYVKFSYLQEDGMQRVGTKSVTFKQVLEAMQQISRK